MGVLYKLTSPSGKSYIGISSKGLAKRLAQHRWNAVKLNSRSNDYGECRALYNAIAKYGLDNFCCMTLAEESDWDTLLSMERIAIRDHGTMYPGGYNLTLGGEGALGARPSVESRKRMSCAQKQANRNPEILAGRMASLSKAVAARAKNWHKKSKKEKLEWGVRHGEAVSRGHAKPESKIRTIEAAKRRAADPLFRKKLSDSQKGVKRKPWTEERKRAASELRRIEWADPLMRAKRLAGFARYHKERSERERAN